MDATPDPRLFADVDQIVTDENNRITYEHEARLTSISAYYKLTRRQAGLVIEGVRKSITIAAAAQGTDPLTLYANLTTIARASIYAYTAGAVNQHDVEAGLDPETGDPRP